MSQQKREFDQYQANERENEFARELIDMILSAAANDLSNDFLFISEDFAPLIKKYQESIDCFTGKELELLLHIIKIVNQETAIRCMKMLDRRIAQYKQSN